MKKIMAISLFIVLLIIISFYFFINRKPLYDENTLYSINFSNTIIRVERYDYSLGQNQIVGIEKSTNNGKTYKKITKEPITISMEPKFLFINKQLGFIITKSNLTKSNNYQGIKVTQDGGRTFTDAIINYENLNADILTIENVPFKNNNKLKLLCSVYQVKNDKSGYENIMILFTSNDNGLTWNKEK